MRKFCTSLREYATNVINLKKGNITNNKTRTKITNRKRSYKIKSIDSARFMASLWSNLVDNLAEGIPKIK